MNNVSGILRGSGIIPFSAVTDAKHAVNLAAALYHESIPCMEIQYADVNTTMILRDINKNIPDFCAGVRVNSPEQMLCAVEFGARFITGSMFECDIMKKCLDTQTLFIPICTSENEVKDAISSGIETVGLSPQVSNLSLSETACDSPQFLPFGCAREDISNLLSCKNVFACGVDWLCPTGTEAMQADEFAAQCKQTMYAAHGFSLAHIGINESSEKAAFQVATALCELLCVPLHDAGKAFFAGSLVEVMKRGGLGNKGHIGFYTNDVERAAAYFQRKGFGLNVETAMYDENGRLTFIYLDIEVAGFACIGRVNISVYSLNLDKNREIGDYI